MCIKVLLALLNVCRKAPLKAKSRSIYQFTDVREVEILTRCCRKWIDPETLDPAAIALAERVIKVSDMQAPCTVPAYLCDVRQPDLGPRLLGNLDPAAISLAERVIKVSDMQAACSPSPSLCVMCDSLVLDPTC